MFLASFPLADQTDGHVQIARKHRKQRVDPVLTRHSGVCVFTNCGVVYFNTLY